MRCNKLVWLCAHTTLFFKYIGVTWAKNSFSVHFIECVHVFCTDIVYCLNCYHQRTLELVENLKSAPQLT